MSSVNFPKHSLGVIFLIIFLFLFGLIQVSNVRFVWMDIIMGICAIIAAIFLALGK